MTNHVAGPWVYFFGEDGGEPTEGRIDRYTVDQIIPVSGESFLAVQADRFFRIETENPLSPDRALEAKFRGVVRHLQYTTQTLRKELQARSAKEYPATGATAAVLIPIRKSAAWWALAQDERQQHFHQPASRENHSTIGHSYADRIYRKLYHSRYFDILPEYDFLTYFEFPKEDTGTFKSLLQALRDVERNPEWKFVERETEIWMTKQ